MAISSLIKAWSYIQFETVKDKLNKKSFELSSGEAFEKAEQIRKDGLCVIPDYYSSEVCDAIVAEIDRLIAEEKANAWQDDEGSDTRLYGSHLYSDLIERFHTDPFLIEIGERYLRSELINSHTLGAKLIPKMNNLGSGGGWHRDSVFKKQYKSILYLTDVDEENGPFQFVMGSHNKSTIYSSIKRNGFTAHQNRISNDSVNTFLQSHQGFESKICTASKGTVILVDTSGIHRGMPIIKGSRYALTNYFYPKHHFNQRQKEKFQKLF